MSIKRNMGNRNESILSQTLGVDFVDYSYNACKSTKVSAAETQSTKYQESTDNLGVPSKENMLRFGSTDITGNATEKVKKKSRRSMLGQRTKLHNLDSALNINKNIPLIALEPYENNSELTTNKEQAYNYFTDAPNEKFLKPLHSSSPYSEIQRQQNSVLEKSKNNQFEAQTPPNPFECSESPSKFFETGIDEISAWSVFKTKLNGLKSPPASKEMDVKRSVPQLSKSPVKKNLKMKLFENTCGNKNSNGRSFRDDDGVSGPDSSKNRESSKRPEQLDWTRYKQNNIKESSKQSIIEYSKSFSFDLENDYTQNSTSGITKKEIYMSDVSHNTNKGECTINNSDEDYDSLNDTIVAATQKSASKTPKLSVICEEEDNSENKNFLETSLNSASSGHSSDTKEEASSQENSNIKLELEQLNEICVTVQKHSNNIDKLLGDLYKEKKQYNIHFSKLQESIKHLQTKCLTLPDNSFDQNVYNNSNSLNKKKKKKRVISCKIKQSPALMLTPENRFASPCSSNKLSKKKKDSFLNNYKELRKSFSYLQTPEHKSAKKTQINNSVIYTPKSLSVCISEQMKRLDS